MFYVGGIIFGLASYPNNGAQRTAVYVCCSTPQSTNAANSYDLPSTGLTIRYGDTMTAYLATGGDLPTWMQSIVVLLHFLKYTS